MTEQNQQPDMAAPTEGTPTPSYEPTVEPETVAWDAPTSESTWRPVETPPPTYDTTAPVFTSSADPYGQPSAPPYGQPSAPPYGQPSAPPYGQPSANPYAQPAAAAYQQPSAQPSANPYQQPAQPYGQPGVAPYGAGGPVAYGQNPNWNAGPTASGQSTLTMNYWLSVFFTWIPALVFYLTEKDKNALMDEHLKENMNFALTRLIVFFVMVIPIIGTIIGGIAAVVLFVIAILGALNGPTAYAQGRPYRFPINFRMIK